MKFRLAILLCLALAGPALAQNNSYEEAVSSYEDKDYKEAFTIADQLGHIPVLVSSMMGISYVLLIRGDTASAGGSAILSCA